jgi:uncharacterized protein YuzE
MNKDNISIDTEHNLVYITILDSIIDRTVVLSNGVNLDLDGVGRITGIELMLNSEDASHFL